MPLELVGQAEVRCWSPESALQRVVLWSMFGFAAGALIAGPGAGPLSGQESIAWSACPDASGLECATMAVPLDHARPGGPAMAVGLRRLRGSGDGGRQLWYLAGGPGDPVGGGLGRLRGVLDDPELDLYGIDHRGTGDSADLRCPDQEAADSFDGSEIVGEEWQACIAHIVATREDLWALTATQSAWDLGRAIERVGDDAERAGARRPESIVFGASYGSFWANRYLHLYPHQPAGVILDGVVPADWSFAEFDQGLDAAAREWLARCGANAECGAHMGRDPTATVEGVLGRLDEGHCPALGVDAETARLLMGVTLMVDDIPNAVIPALAYRLGRCDWHDQMALLHFVRAALSGVGEASTHSPVLQRHVALSEMWNESDPSSDSLEALVAGTVATTAVSSSFSHTWPDWPRYAPDPLDGAQAPFDGPMLILHGGLDPTMPAGRLTEIRETYAGENQTFLVIPEAGHVTVNYSGCSRTLYAQFLADPRAGVDTGCVGEETFVEFQVDASTANAIFGRPDLWTDRVPLLETAWFRLRYNVLPILVLLVGLGLFGRRSTADAPLDRRAVIAIGLSLVIAFGAYVLVASVTLLLPYNSSAANISVLGIAALQLLLMAGLSRWASRVRKNTSRRASART